MDIFLKGHGYAHKKNDYLPRQQWFNIVRKERKTEKQKKKKTLISDNF